MQNPKLGDSILLGETRWRLSVTGGRGQTWGVSPTLLSNLPVLGPGKPGGQEEGLHHQQASRRHGWVRDT